jgi:hypothetical protein
MVKIAKLKFSKNKINNFNSGKNANRLLIFTLFLSVFIFSAFAKAAATSGNTSYINLIQIQLDQQLPESVMPEKKEESNKKANSKYSYISYFLLLRIKNNNTEEFIAFHQYFQSGDSSPNKSDSVFNKNHNLRI